VGPFSYALTYRRWTRFGSLAMIVAEQQRHGGIMKQKIATIALVAVALGAAACNTVRGAGQDVQSVANCTENTVHGNNC
jgi:predicted small secreted protein